MVQTYTVAVIGAGTMGSGITQKLAQEGLDVTLVDVTEEQVTNGLQKIKELLNVGVEKKVFSEKFVNETLRHIKTTTNYEDVKDVDLVVEAVFEDMKVKGEVLKKLDGICDSKTILSSNTSSFYISELAKYTNRPDKFLGMHYFFHPAKNRLLEIVPHEGTSSETVELANKIADLHNKTAITVKDSPGFAVNRFFVPWLNEATHLVEDNVANIPTVDAAAEKTFKIGMGPFKLMNASGIPIAHHSAETLEKEISEFYKPTDLLVNQSKSGKLWITNGEVDESKFDIIAERLLATTIGAAGALVDEEVASIEATNRGAVVGLRWKVGPFQLANEYGVKETYDMVKRLSENRPGFKVAEVLKNQYRRGELFEFSYIDLEVKNEIAYITINRPEAMNALNPTVVKQLTQKFDDAEKDPNVKAIVIRGAGKAFIAGADIKFFIDCIKTDTVEKIVEFTSNGHKLFRRFETSKKLTVAVVDGVSLGGGSELALACQAIIATEQGSFQFPESGLGIYPGLGGMLRINKQVGKELAKYFALTGKPLSAKEAKELGIVNKVVSAGEVQTAIEELVNQGKVDKYAPREFPEQFKERKMAFLDENIDKLSNGKEIEGISNIFVRKTSKSISFKGPNAVKVINNIINKETSLSIDEGIQLEISELAPIFRTKEALIGLEASISGARPNFNELSKLAKLV